MAALRAASYSAEPSSRCMPADALDQVVVAEGVGHPQVAGGAEGLAGDDGDLGLLQDQLGQLARWSSAVRPAIGRPSRPFTDG